MKENKNYIWTAFSWDSVRRTDAPFIVDDNNASIHRWIQHENRSRVLTHTSIGYRKWSVAHAHNRFWWPFCCWAVRCASRILHSKKSPPKLVATSLITPPPPSHKVVACHVMQWVVVLYVPQPINIYCCRTVLQHGGDSVCARTYVTRTLRGSVVFHE